MNNIVLAAGDPLQQAQVLGVRHGQPLVEDLLGDGEGCGVGSDGQRQRDGGNRRESRRAPEHANSIAQIGADLIPPAQSERRPHVFLVRPERAHRDPRLPRRFFTRESGAFEVGGEMFEMILEFGFHLVVQTITMRGAPQPRAAARHQSAEQAHTSSGVVRRIPSMTPDMRFHLAAS